MIIPIDSEKALGKIQYIFMIKISRELGIKGNISYVIKKKSTKKHYRQHHTQWQNKNSINKLYVSFKIRKKKTSTFSLTILIQHFTGSLN